tara:strand:- start:923 stop:1396 length:474 start_codon:yes stop_codon:yes gene_type:complete
MNIVKNYWPLVVLLFSSLAITIALIAEFLFEINPCSMCLYQRYPYYFIIIFTLIYLVSKKINFIIYSSISLITFILGLFFSIWHVGIENKILPSPAGCSGGLDNFDTKEDLKKQILNQNIVPCDEVVWSFLNISAATYNTLLLIILLALNMYVFKKN